MDDKKIRYFPFHAINEYMLPDYRHDVILTVLRDADKLPGDRRGAIKNLVKRHVAVPGFRNSTLAPVGVKTRGAVSAFERQPQFTALVLQGWSDLHPELREKVHAMLTTRSWEALLPAEADRSKLPGFLTTWPKSETYDVLDQAFKDLYPDFETTDNDVRLMVVWVANRLPYDLFEDEAEEES
jgi:hypothetical protein